jgi:hypothetical protein
MLPIWVFCKSYARFNAPPKFWRALHYSCNLILLWYSIAWFGTLYYNFLLATVSFEVPKTFSGVLDQWGQNCQCHGHIC